MSRMPPPPDPESLAPLDREAFERVVFRMRKMDPTKPFNVAGYYGALLNAPPMAELMNTLANHHRSCELRGSYANRDRELVDVVLSDEYGFKGPLRGHIPDAVAGGVRPEAIAAIVRHREEDLTPDERELATYIRLVARGEVTDEWAARMERRFGRRGYIEFTAFIGYLTMVIRLQQAFGVPEPSAAEIDALIDGHLAGTAPVPDPRIASRIW